MPLLPPTISVFSTNRLRGLLLRRTGGFCPGPVTQAGWPRGESSPAGRLLSLAAAHSCRMSQDLGTAPAAVPRLFALHPTGCLFRSDADRMIVRVAEHGSHPPPLRGALA